MSETMTEHREDKAGDFSGDMGLAVVPMAVDQGLVGVMRVPGDKSISHRSIILGAVAE
ncbi:MAG TPA: hypothetical protein HPQ00_14305, partial [Magnetococcales bacterium]|nr:hypothetical protein [Magnetococcales bacterium]